MLALGASSAASPFVTCCDLEALPLEGAEQRLRDREVVFDEQDRGHRRRERTGRSRHVTHVPPETLRAGFGRSRA